MARSSPSSPASAPPAAPSPVVDIYVRLSRNPDGDLERLDTQEADCRAVAQRRGWTVGAVHGDNSLSAWKRSVRRPAWETMLDRLKNRQADGVVVYDTDRLMRQPRDLETLIDFGERDGLLLAAAHGEYDLSRSDDQFILRIKTASAKKSSDDTSRRIRRRFEYKREQGMTTGGARPFGFPGPDRTAAKDPDTGARPDVPIEQVERERAALRKGARDMIAGAVTLSRLTARWNDAELVTATGEPWTSVKVRAALLRARNAGLVEHDGVVVGRNPESAIYDETLHDELRAVFAARRRGRPTGEKSLASGLIFCGACGHSMGSRPAGTYRDGSPRRQYVCGKASGGCGTVAADAAGMDAELRKATIVRLGDRGHVARLSARASAAVGRREEIDTELGRARDTAVALGDRLGRGEIEPDVFDAGMRPVRARIARLEAERDELAGEPIDAPQESDADAVAAEWDHPEATTATRRALLAMAMRGWRAQVAPATRRGAFDPERLSIVPADSR